MFGKNKEKPIPRVGSGTSRTSRMIRGNTSTSTPMLNHTQAIMGHIYGNSYMKKIVSRAEATIRKCAWKNKYFTRLFQVFMLQFLHIYPFFTKISRMSLNGPIQEKSISSSIKLNIKEGSLIILTEWTTFFSYMNFC